MTSPILQFGEYELDIGRYELRKGGRRIKIQRIPMELLILLAQGRGELVTRDEIAERLWGRDQAGDPELSVNTAIRKVRRALGDDAGQPRFVETVVGKGYRFIPEVLPGAVDRAKTGRDHSVHAASAALGQSGPSRFSRISVMAGLAGAAVAGWMWFRTPAVVASMRVAPFTTLPGLESMPAFSPDGSQVAFSWNGEGDDGQHIYIKAVGVGPQIRLTSSGERDSSPAWSPDGRTIAFLRENPQHGMAVYAIPASGGAERKVQALSAPNRSRLSWSADGKGLAVMDSEAPELAPSIFLLSVDSTSRVRLTHAVDSGRGDWWPAFSPDGMALAFLRNTGSYQASTPFVMPVDRHGVPTGEARKVPSDRADLTGLEWSADGRSLICSALEGLVRIPVSGGAAERLPFQNASQPTVSGRGNRLVFAQAVEETGIFRIPGAGAAGDASKLIGSTRFNGSPRYSPDGKQIVFMSNRTGSDELWVTDSEGQHAAQITSFGRATLGSPRWSRDSRSIAFDATPEGLANIYVIGAEGGSARRITSGGSANVRPSWSGDGRWIYFGSNRSGRWEIWKTTLQGETTIQVTRSGGREGFENPDGTFLYYSKAAPTEGIWRQPVSGGEAEQISAKGLQGHWDIGERGLYYLNSRNEIELAELPGGRRVQIPMPGLRAGSFGIGPGDHWILLTVRVRSESDLWVVENFR